jgi:hypothetical protein
VTLPSSGREGSEIEALVTDRYLDTLLAAPAPMAVVPPELEPDDGLRAIADRLARLPRIHPSFRFEEALSARLTAAALARRLPAAAGAEGSVIALGHDPGPGSTDADLSAYIGSQAMDEDADLVRPLLIGGALTSAALSLAGAAYVAWRLRRPVGTPMVRAVRAVARTRLT